MLLEIVLDKRYFYTNTFISYESYLLLLFNKVEHVYYFC